MSAVQDRFNDTLSRADELLRERLRREQAQLEAEDAEREREAVERARAHAERRTQIQAVYADAFAAFGSEVPAPSDDETPRHYRRRLYQRLRRKLAPDHELAQVRADDLPAGQAFVNFEAMMLAAAKQEGLTPSMSNLPPDGSLVTRTRVDSETGEKATHFYGRESFIASIGRPGRRVACILDRDHNVLWGRPLARQSTFVR